MCEPCENGALWLADCQPVCRESTGGPFRYVQAWSVLPQDADRAGGMHTHCLAILEGCRRTCAEYSLADGFARLTGAFYLRADGREGPARATLALYGDGRLLLKQTLTTEREPVPVSLPLGGVGLLRVELSEPFGYLGHARAAFGDAALERTQGE